MYACRLLGVKHTGSGHQGIHRDKGRASPAPASGGGLWLMSKRIWALESRELLVPFIIQVTQVPICRTDSAEYPNSNQTSLCRDWKSHLLNYFFLPSLVIFYPSSFSSAKNISWMHHCFVLLTCFSSQLNLCVFFYYNWPKFQNVVIRKR